MRSMIYLFIISTLTTACVTKGKYEDLRIARDAEIAGLQEKIREYETEISDSETLIAQLEQKLGSATTDKESMQKSVNEMKEALQELSLRKRETEKRVAEYQDLLKRFKALTDSGQLKIKMIDGRMVVVLPSDVLFDSGSTGLSEKGLKTLKKVGQLLASIPEKNYQIEGHTDNVPIKTSSYPSNWELAAARAMTVTKVILSSGLQAHRISAASFGEHKPVGDNSTDEGKAANRRIEIVIVPDLSTLPGYEELNEFSSGNLATNK